MLITRRLLITHIAVILATGAVIAQESLNSIAGMWITVEGKRQESIVQIYKAKNGLWYGQVKEILVPGQEQAVCEKCSGDNKGKPLVGMIIIKDMHPNGNKLSDGKILDPKRGRWFDCTIKMNGNDLSVRGSLGPFGETKTWIRKTD